MRLLMQFAVIVAVAGLVAGCGVRPDIVSDGNSVTISVQVIDLTKQ